MDKGFASLFALLTALLLFGFGETQNHSQNAFSEAMQGMIEAEQNNFARSQLEENTDRIIEKTLEQKLQQGESDPVAANRAVAEKLFQFIQKTESENQNTRFYWVETSPESYDRILLLQTNPLNSAEIEAMTKTIIIRQGRLAVAETVFVGEKNQNRVLIAHIRSPNHADFFLIPLRHTTRVEVVV